MTIMSNIISTNIMTTTVIVSIVVLLGGFVTGSSASSPFQIKEQLGTENNNCAHYVLCSLASNQTKNSDRIKKALAALDDDPESVYAKTLKLGRDNQCEKYFSCPMSSNELLPELESMMSEEPTNDRVRRSVTFGRQGTLMGRPFRKPKHSESRRECRKCEGKRSICTTYYILTYGLCGAGAWLGGTLVSVACNVVTLPRTVDCVLNTWFNCFQKNCGLIGFK